MMMCTFFISRYHWRSCCCFMSWRPSACTTPVVSLSALKPRSLSTRASSGARSRAGVSQSGRPRPPIPVTGGGGILRSLGIGADSLSSLGLFPHRPSKNHTLFAVFTPCSYHVELKQLFLGGDAPIAEPGQVDALPGAMADPFRDGPPDGRRLLDAMAGKSVCEQEIRYLRMGPDDAVLVERVVVVMAGPGACQLDRGKGRNALRQSRPNHLLPNTVCDLEVLAVGILVLRRRDAAHEALAFRPHEHAARIDHQRQCRLQALAAFEDIDEALLRHDREVEPGHRGKLAAMRAGGIHHHLGCDRRSAGQPDAGQAIALALETHDLVGHIDRTLGPRLAAKRLQQRIGIEPAFADEAERAGGDAADIEPRKALFQRPRLEDHVGGAEAALEAMIGLQHGQPGLACQEEVAALEIGDLGGLAIDGEIVAEMLEEMHAEGRKPNILLGGELLADRAQGERGRGPCIGRVALDHQHAALRRVIGRQPIGAGAADRAAADDDDIIVFGHRSRTIRDRGWGGSQDTIFARARRKGARSRMASGAGRTYIGLAMSLPAARAANP